MTLIRLPEPPPPGATALPPGTFDGTAVFVTGGGTGLGKAIALEFARLGAAIVIASRKDEHLDAGAEAMGALGARALTTTCDIREPEQIAAAFDAAETAFGLPGAWVQEYYRAVYAAIEMAARVREIPIVNLCAALNEVVAAGARPFNTPIHLTSEGNELMARRLLSSLSVQRCRVYDEYVRQPIIVVVEDAHALTSGLENIFLVLRGSRYVARRQTRILGNVVEVHSDGR